MDLFTGEPYKGTLVWPLFIWQISLYGDWSVVRSMREQAERWELADSCWPIPDGQEGMGLHHYANLSVIPIHSLVNNQNTNHW